MAALSDLRAFYFYLLFLFGIHNGLSFMDMDELKSVYYGLEIKNEPVVIDEQVAVGAVFVSSKYGQQYQCSFPDHTIDDKKKEEEEKIAEEQGIVEMLKPMGSRDCLIKSKDWWHYEFCYGNHVRQFHMEDGEIKGAIIYLGYYESDFDWANETAKNERLKSKGFISRYHSQSYSQGTKCDLTGQMRSTEVRFICEENSEDFLSRIDESETCVYTVTVVTSRVCRHPYLKPPVKRKPVPITCNPLLTQDQYEEYQLQAEEEREELARQKQQVKQTTLRDKLAEMDTRLSKKLEDEMSTAAKELLTRPIDNLFPRLKKDGALDEEAFHKMFGNNQGLLDLYKKGLEYSRKQLKEKQESSTVGETTEEKIEEKAEETTQEKSQEGTSEVSGQLKGEPDEDNEVLADFEDEIQQIKSSFATSKYKLSSIRTKLTKEKNWRSEIEDAIKEAEEEHGVKIDRNVLSGLSNTLDKLLNKLEDTETELSSMDEEISALKPGKKGEAADAKENEENSGDEGMEEESSFVLTGDVEEEALEDKIIPPPSSDLPSSQGPPVHGTQSTFPNPKSVEEKLEESANEERGIVEEQKTSTASADGSLAEGGGSSVEESPDVTSELPSDVKKLLMESLKKEQNKNQDRKSLHIDDDHSFTKDRTMHVIQQEDEEGKTNRYIFVFGLTGFDDESVETERQEKMEENYSFVYKEKTGKRRDKEPVIDS